MISMYSDAAIEQPFSARANVRSINARSAAVVNRRDSPSLRERSDPDAAGATPESVVRLLSSKTLHDDSLDAARGMMFAVVLGLGCWMVIGGILRMAFF